jgi:hypothetical protein
MNPEAMNADSENLIAMPGVLGGGWFMGSGLGPMGRPGMTKVISGQALM